MNKPNFDGPGYQVFRQFLQSQCGILLGDNKQYLVSSRLGSMMAKYQTADLSQLVGLAERRGSSLRQEIIDAMTTNETLWFRDTYPFSVLQERFVPELANQGQPLRIWSAACSSGQEPYSISISLRELLQRSPKALPSGYEIIGTDISGNILKQAEAGIYDSLALSRGLSDERRTRFFTPVDNTRWQISPQVSSAIKFRSLNLLDSYQALGRFQVIFCRNVLIYFSAELKADIINRMAKLLTPKGYLVLGSSESVTGLSDQFEMVHCRPGIVYRLK